MSTIKQEQCKLKVNQSLQEYNLPSASTKRNLYTMINQIYSIFERNRAMLSYPNEVKSFDNQVKLAAVKGTCGF